MDDEIRLALAEALQTAATAKSIRTCSRWAAKRRVMGEPFPGKYSWKYHPWVRDIHDTQATYNYIMKAAQLGCTEVAINRAFYVLDQLKRDVLYVLPTALNASDFAKARFNVALRHSPYLEQMFTNTNAVNLKQTATNSLYIRGSRGDSNLKSIPVSELILDETDEMDMKQVWLALERLSGHLEKHVWALSTPTIPNWGIHKLFLTSTQEHYFFKAPCCGRRTELVWPDSIKICGETVTDPRCHESYLVCKECGATLNHRSKPEWLKGATWEPTAHNGNPDVRGFYINQLYSFTVTPGEIAVAYFRTFGDEAANKELHNSKLGVPFVGEGAQVTNAMIDECIGNHTAQDARPKLGGERTIVMGVDQGKMCHYVVMEFLVDRFGNDINVASKGKLLAFGKYYEEDWNVLDNLMREWQVLGCVIDADPQINEARRFARRFPRYVWLCRYRRGKTAKEIAISEQDTLSPMATVDRTNWMSAALGRFKTHRIILPRDISLEFRDHVKAPVRTYEPDESGNPQATFVSTAQDHLAHALVYAEIALPLAASVATGQDIESFL